MPYAIGSQLAQCDLTAWEYCWTTFTSSSSINHLQQCVIALNKQLPSTQLLQPLSLLLVLLIDLASMNRGMELAYLFLYKIPSSHDVHQALIFHTFVNTNMLQSFKY